MLAIIHWELRMRSSPLVVRSPGASVHRCSVVVVWLRETSGNAVRHFCLFSPFIASLWLVLVSISYWLLAFLFIQ